MKRRRRQRRRDATRDRRSPEQPAPEPFDRVLARELDAPSVDRIDPSPDAAFARPTTASTSAPLASDLDRGPGPDVDVWERLRQARAEAELLVVPSVATVAVVGPVDRARSVIELCRAQRWDDDGAVVVLTNRPNLVDDPWTAVGRGSDLVDALEADDADFPLLVIDVPRELPLWVRPLVERLRNGGVGMVHYALLGEPSDEDLATWHGEVGRPSVLDLVSPVDPGRVLELIERGEPIASVAGFALGPELLLALQTEVAHERQRLDV